MFRSAGFHQQMTPVNCSMSCTRSLSAGPCRWLRRIRWRFRIRHYFGINQFLFAVGL